MAAEIVKGFLIVIWDIVSNFSYYFFLLMWKFYTEFLPFLIIYIGIPLFVIGVLLALSFSGGMVLIVAGFGIGLYLLIQYGIFDVNPYAVKSNTLANTTTSKKIFKSNF